MNIIVNEGVRELMQEQGLNQTSLAKQIGVKQNTMSAWLLNKKQPSIASLLALADFFDVEIDYIVGRKND